MTLISMLIALIVERLAVRSDAWQFWPYARKYLSFSKEGVLAKLAKHPQGQYLWVVLPGLVYAGALLLLDSGLVTLVLNTLVLLLSIGCWHYRQMYKHYLNATERGDNEAAFLTMEQLSKEVGLDKDELSYGQRLVWLNFRYYAAVLFWFALFGGAGALTYALLRQLSEPMTHQSTQVQDIAELERFEVTDKPNEALVEAAPVNPSQELVVDTSVSKDVPEESLEKASSEAEQQEATAATTLLFWADWLPVRLFGVGFALVGYFSKASTVLVSFLGNTKTPSHQVLTEIAKAAEPLPEESYNGSEETACMVQLAKRNILFFLALIAILTLSGWLS